MGWRVCGQVGQALSGALPSFLRRPNKWLAGCLSSPAGSAAPQANARIFRSRSSTPPPPHKPPDPVVQSPIATTVLLGRSLRLHLISSRVVSSVASHGTITCTCGSLGSGISRASPSLSGWMDGRREEKMTEGGCSSAVHLRVHARVPITVTAVEVRVLLLALRVVPSNKCVHRGMVRSMIHVMLRSRAPSARGASKGVIILQDAIAKPAAHTHARLRVCQRARARASKVVCALMGLHQYKDTHVYLYHPQRLQPV
ncbi:hypothetical protein BJV74DRAFT_868808 [Russula compacta]|nr:hypothetical protein BJV74DRAFT_868808 [Russula compacta]